MGQRWCCDAAVGWEGEVSAWLPPFPEDFSAVFCCQALRRGRWGGAEEGPGAAVPGGACMARGGGSHCGHLHRASLCPLLALGMGCHVWLRTMTPVSICARLVGHSCYGAVWGTAVPEEQCLAGDTGTQTTQGTLGHSSIMMVLGIPCSFQSWWSVPLFQGAVLAYGVSPGCYSL